jgi:hypothetical protein
MYQKAKDALRASVRVVAAVARLRKRLGMKKKA